MAKQTTTEKMFNNPPQRRYNQLRSFAFITTFCEILETFPIVHRTHWTVRAHLTPLHWARYNKKRLNRFKTMHE